MGKPFRCKCGSSKKEVKDIPYTFVEGRYVYYGCTSVLRVVCASCGRRAVE